MRILEMKKSSFIILFMMQSRLKPNRQMIGLFYGKGFFVLRCA